MAKSPIMTPQTPIASPPSSYRGPSGATYDGEAGYPKRTTGGAGVPEVSRDSTPTYVPTDVVFGPAKNAKK